MQALDAYQSLKEPAEAMYKVKGSKHYGYVFPISHPDEAKFHLDALRKKHHDARHHAYAYRLGVAGDNWRASDDGEPANSAGPPILGALKSREITDCLAVVVRYFGGTKLGVGGLIDAYRTAALMAIDQARVVKRFVEQKVAVSCSYELLGTVLSTAEKHGAQVVSQSFTELCVVHLTIRQSKAESLTTALDDVYGCQRLSEE